MPNATLFRLSDVMIKVMGAVDADHARSLVREDTKRDVRGVTRMDKGVFHVELGLPMESPSPIYAEAKARGVILHPGDVVWDQTALAWTIEGMDPAEWLDAMAPVQQKVMYMVAARVPVDPDSRVQQVQIETARHVLADNVVDAINALSMFLDGTQFGVPVIERQNALTYARYPGTVTPRFVACTGAVNQRLRIADVTGAVITA